MITTSEIGLIVSLAGEPPWNHGGHRRVKRRPEGRSGKFLVRVTGSWRIPGARAKEKRPATTARVHSINAYGSLPNEEKPRIDDETIAAHCRCPIALEDLSFRVANSRRQLVTFDASYSCFRRVIK